MMKKTDHHLSFEKNNNVLVLFNGPHCFINANWYTDPGVGSTWNYMTVHAKGKISFFDEEGTRNAVKVLSDKYAGTSSPASFDNLPKEYIDRMVKAIVGFSIAVESLDNVFKLSQNRDEASQKNIIAQLKQRGDDNSVMIAEEMERRLL
jgi:transcriptional regulator